MVSPTDRSLRAQQALRFLASEHVQENDNSSQTIQAVDKGLYRLRVLASLRDQQPDDDKWPSTWEKRGVFQTWVKVSLTKWLTEEDMFPKHLQDEAEKLKKAAGPLTTSNETMEHVQNDAGQEPTGESSSSHSETRQRKGKGRASSSEAEYGMATRRELTTVPQTKASSSMEPLNQQHPPASNSTAPIQDNDSYISALTERLDKSFSTLARRANPTSVLKWTDASNEPNKLFHQSQDISFGPQHAGPLQTSQQEPHQESPPPADEYSVPWRSGPGLPGGSSHSGASTVLPSDGAADLTHKNLRHHDAASGEQSSGKPPREWFEWYKRYHKAMKESKEKNGWGDRG
ncbi:hypothetical protein ACHAPQ_006028 [Fusarium lateritium]